MVRRLSNEKTLFWFNFSFPLFLVFSSLFHLLFLRIFWGCLYSAALVDSLVNVHFSCLLTQPATSCRLHTEVPSTRCLREELVWLQQSLSKLGSPVVLCHNDLLCKNIIYNQGAGEYKLQRCSRWHYCVTDLCCSVNCIGSLRSGRIVLP